MENCDICANDVFRDSWKGAGVERRAFEAPPAMPAKGKSAPAAAPATGGAIDQEALVQAITDRVMAELAKR
jgi:L-fuculose-phosphate aldolase